MFPLWYFPVSNPYWPLDFLPDFIAQITAILLDTELSDSAVTVATVLDSAVYAATLTDSVVYIVTLSDKSRS